MTNTQGDIMDKPEVGTKATAEVEEAPEGTAVYQPTEGMDVYSLMESVVGAEDAKDRVETLRALMELRNDEQDRAASGDFTRAFVQFHRTCPPIPRDTKGKSFADKKGVVVSTLMFSGLETIQRVTYPVLGPLGFACSFTVPNATENSIKVRCDLYHESGHTRASEMFVPVSAIQQATRGQEYAGAYTTGKRLTLSGVLGLATEDLNAEESRELGLVIDEDQLRVLQELVSKKDVVIDEVLKHVDAESLSDVLASQYGMLKQFLETRKDPEAST